jgi:hypothetical protein
MLSWNRTVSSDWRRGSLVHVDDIIVDDPRHSALLPELVEKDARKGLQAGYPTLSIDDTDVVYLKTKVNKKDRKAWVIAVDMRKKTVVGVAPFSDARSMYARPNYITCALSKYLNSVNFVELCSSTWRCVESSTPIQKIQHVSTSDQALHPDELPPVKRRKT